MSKLREKFQKWLDTNPREQIIAVQCEQIADDFAVKFANFATNNTDYDCWDDKFDYKGVLYTSTELLQIFKDKYYE
jgi:hypothetical protein